MLVKDLMPGVKRKLGGRVDSDSVSSLWIKDAVKELTESYPFEELKVNGPVVNFSPGISEYLITFFTNNNERPTIINSWFVSSTSTISTVITGNSGNTGRYLKYRTIPVLDIMSKQLGPPSKWTRNGTKFIVGSAPDQNYATQMRYQREHPFLCDEFDPVALQQQTIQMPTSWSIIIEFQAAMIGATENRMLDYRNDYHSILYGDPDYRKTGRGNPGLIFGRTSNYDRDSSNNERQIQMVVMRQCAG